MDSTPQWEVIFTFTFINFTIKNTKEITSTPGLLASSKKMSKLLQHAIIQISPTEETTYHSF